MRHRISQGGRLGLLIVFWGVATALAADPGPVVERAVVRLVRLPVLFEEEHPGACSGLRGEQVEVREDGLSVGPVYLEATRLPSSHAILLDTGHEMLDHLGAVRAALSPHVAALPASDPAMLVTFDDSLVLQAPLSADRGRFDRGLEWVEIGDGRNLWDAARQLIRYLGPLPGSKVLTLLTDGCDTQRVAAVSSSAVIEELGNHESVVVFAIGVELPAQCPGTDIDPAEGLRALSRASGGEFHALDRIDRLDTILAGIRERLAHVRAVQYEPAAFGHGPKDDPERQDHRHRRLQLSVRGVPGCRGKLAGSPTRFESPTRDVHRAGAGSSAAGEPIFKDAGGSRLEADVVDVVLEGAVRQGSRRLVGQRRDPAAEQPRRTATRRVVALVPALDSVVRPDAGPATALFNALEAVARPPLGQRAPILGGDGSAWTEVPFLVNGRTLLEARAGLARALADQPEFGRWAFRRVLEARLATLDGVIEQASTVELRDALLQARAGLTQQSWSPQPAELETYLGAWLGDARAPELLNAAETWLARRLMDSVAGGRPERLDPAAAETERLWRMIQRWFPPATDTPSLGLLVPGYDPERDLIGYYRVILKQSTAFAIHSTFSAAVPTGFVGAGAADDADSLYARLQSWNHSRDAPLGARLVRWMLELESARPVLERLQLASIRYATPNDRDLYPLLDRIGLSSRLSDQRSYPARLVSLTLTERGSPDRQFKVHAYFPTLPGNPAGYAAAPSCLVLPDDPPRDGLGFELLGSLFRALQDSPFPCVLQTAADAAGGSSPSGG